MFDINTVCDNFGPYKAKFNQELNDYLNEPGVLGCQARYVFNYVTQHQNGKIKLCIDASKSPTFSAITNTMTFTGQDAIISTVIKHEMFHAFQNLVYNNGIGQYQIEGNPGLPNIEFDYALYNDILGSWVRTPPNAISSYEYSQWIDEITEGGTTYPWGFDADLQERYDYFLKQFAEAKYSKPFNTGQAPTGLLYTLGYCPH